MRPLRVAFCLDTMGVGGTELNAVRTAEHLVQNGYDVRVLVMRNEGPLVARYAANGIPVEEFRLAGLARPSTAAQVLAMRRWFRRHRVDVVHAHDRYSNVVAVAAAWLARVPCIIASKRWMWWPPKFRAVNAVAYRFATRVLANSDAVAATLRSSEHVPADRIIVVPNFLEESAFEPIDAATRDAFRERWALADEDVVIGVVARLASVKNHAMLLAAAAQLRARWPRARYALIGDGPERDALEAKAASLGVSDVVRFVGQLPHAPNPHGYLDVSVLCSTFEGFPNSVVEAMAAGRPVVATAVGGVVDAVTDGETGFLVASDDAAALAAALDALLSDSRRRAQMGEAGRERARQRYHVSVVMPLLESTYCAFTTANGRR